MNWLAASVTALFLLAACNTLPTEPVSRDVDGAEKLN
jgi:predicted small secreted protein